MMHNGFWLLHWIIPLILFGLIIYGGIMLILNLFDKKSDPALQVLKERYARGEIDEEEFHSKVDFLKKNN